MKILIISDTHGNMRMVNAMLTIANQMDMVIHLGDDYRDAIPFLNQSIPTIRVPWDVGP